MIVNDCVNVVKLLSVGELLSKRCVTIYFGRNILTHLMKSITRVGSGFKPVFYTTHESAANREV